MTLRTRLRGDAGFEAVVSCDGPECTLDMDTDPALDWIMVIVVRVDGTACDAGHYCGKICYITAVECGIIRHGVARGPV